MGTLEIDFGKTTGPVKPLHGVNNTPVSFHPGADPMRELAAAGVPYVRLHDTAGMWGGTHYVDIPNVFPDFSADPDDPAAYDFAFTDAYLAQLVAAGIEPFYRLGVTIENFHQIKAYRIHPPADNLKWARICEGIIRHYNEGWADGFRYDITYWEIWNEPENPPMWTGTKEQYFELYRVAANHLKKTFPDLMVGGYGSCGFYAVTRPQPTAFEQSFVSYFDDFLAYVTDPATAAPLDFFSWHLYSADPYEPAKHAAYVDERLKAYGLDKTESIFNEWNYVDPAYDDMFDRMKAMPGAAFTAAVLCLLQSSPVDKAMYYDALPTRRFCGLFHFPSNRVTKTYYSIAAFNELYQLGTAGTAMCKNANEDVFACAATDSTDAASILVNNGCDPVTVTLHTTGMDKPFKRFILDTDHDMGENGEPVRDGAQIMLAPLSVLLLHTGTPFSSPVDGPCRTGSHNGLDDGDE